MQIQTYLAILLGKLILLLTRSFKIGGGSAAPGLYALKIDPNLVSNLITQVSKNIVITGTNGKTTTARMLSQVVFDSGKVVIRNSTGSNLERGIASSLLSRVSLFGKITDADIGIWEIDEAAFNKVAPIINPQLIVFLNVFRDQLDRYGEVDSVVKNWSQTLKKLNPESIYINGDDRNLLSLKSAFSGKLRTFGILGSQIKGEKTTSTHKPEPKDVLAKQINTSLEKTSFNICLGKNTFPATLPIPGTYHVYDYLAALSCALEFNITVDQVIKSLTNFSPAFGRVERFSLPHREWEANIKQGYIFLIKNPVGASQVIKTIKDEVKPQDTLILALNDNFADGTDVSWIWDTDFEECVKCKVICSGTRAQDLALRLKYAGINGNDIKITEDISQALSETINSLQGNLYILPTYTALLKLQKLLVEKGIKKHYWEED